MQKQPPSLLVHAAKRARRWGEAAQRAGRVPRWWEGLGGGCATCSTRLLVYLQRRGVRAKVAFNDNHAFVICEGWIVDVTATQFGASDAVLITEDKDRYWFHEVEATRATLRGINNWLDRNGWYKCYTENLKLITP